MEKRYVGQDGRVVWIQLTGSLVRDAQDQPDHFVAIIDDITEQKHTEEIRDLLMREVDHRARNALTVVQSVVRLTDADSTDEFKRKVTGRVDALARAQSSLAQENWTGSSLKKVLAEELALVAEASHIEFSGPEIQLRAEQVQPLGMILHEMATNAAKYGALSLRGGRVRISAEQDDDVWRLRWTEHGGPSVTPPERAGFGSRLMTRLASELGGRIEMDWRPEGFAAELTVQAAGDPSDARHPFIGALDRMRRLPAASNPL